MTKKQLSDYVWIARGRKYWRLYIGTPFVCCEYVLPIGEWTEHNAESEALRRGRIARDYFQQQYPGEPWP